VPYNPFYVVLSSTILHDFVSHYKTLDYLFIVADDAEFIDARIMIFTDLFSDAHALISQGCKALNRFRNSASLIVISCKR